ncbi:MAG: NAD-dependent epimerase/dehydratase family protein [Pseudomonadota bacterium]
MRCLVVGGTGFLGGAMAEALAAAGHEVAILSRGRTAGGPAGVEMVRADRHGDLSGLAGRSFDWVFDSCAFDPDAVHHLLDAVGPEVARYVLVSSISAYGSFATAGLTEAASVPDATEADLAVAASIPTEDRAMAAAYGASYGPLKRACEIAAEARLGARATILRVGLLIGAGDYTDRLTWWVRRIDGAHGVWRPVPAPGPASRAVQLIDVRDAAGFAVHCAAAAQGGVWNVTGQPMAMSDLLAAVAEAADSPAEVHWIANRDVIGAGIMPWTEMPLMAPPGPKFRYFLEVNADRAEAAGLTCRPLAETLGPLLEWDRGRRDVPLKCGLSAEQEAALLAIV